MRLQSRFQGLAAFIGAAFLLLSAMTSVLAQDSRADIFRELDTDGDGRISRAEFDVNKVRVIFRKALEREPKLRFEETRLSRRAFDQIDADKNGFITPRDLIVAPLFKFDFWDRNVDGYIDRAEFNAVLDELEH